MLNVTIMRAKPITGMCEMSGKVTRSRGQHYWILPGLSCDIAFVTFGLEYI